MSWKGFTTQLTKALVDSLLSWRHSGFSVHGAVRVEDRQGAVRLGRYMIRCPIVLERLRWEPQAGEVIYTARRARRECTKWESVAAGPSR